MKNMVGINSTEWGHDLHDISAPPLLHRASSPHATVSHTKEDTSYLNTLQLPNSSV